MKIRFVGTVLTIACLSFLSKESISQEAAASISTASASAFKMPSDPVGQFKIAATEVSSKALKNFENYFNDVDNVTWWKQGKEYMAEFRKEGKWVKAYFTAKGNFISSFAITTEEHLPDDIRSQINIVYRKYKIGTVTEVFQNNNTIWFVNLEDSGNYLQLKISDNQIEEVAGYKKSE